MTNNIIQAQYDELISVASRFGKQTEATRQMTDRVRQSMQSLEQGGWEGSGSQAFFAEMNGEVLPAVQRMATALDRARTVTIQIHDLIKAAEEEASKPFHGSYQGETLPSQQEPPSPSPATSTEPEQTADSSGISPFSSSPTNAFVMNEASLDQYLGKSVGSGQCVALPQTYFGTGVIGQTKEWRPGASLMDYPSLRPGTVIATFDNPGPNGKYPNQSAGNHAAIFLGYERDKSGKITGIQVLDQWNGHPAQKRILPYISREEALQKRPKTGGKLLVNQPNDMYVVTNPSKRPVSSL
ncbi:MAG: WXG100 family type VII secretion target [Anaerolineae bacterium]|nr:WXG100 family type VII secretion target [Anaerolineae bacterium]